MDISSGKSLQRALCCIKVPLSSAEDFVPETMPEGEQSALRLFGIRLRFIDGIMVKAECEP